MFKIYKMCRFCGRNVAYHGLCKKHYYGQKKNKWPIPEIELLEIPPYELPSWEKMLKKKFLYEALEQIGERESLIVKLHWLENLTLEDIGQSLDLCKERVRQIEERGLLKLRRLLYRKGIFPTRNNQM